MTFESTPGGDGGFDAFAVVFVVVGLLVLCGFVAVGVAMVRGARASRRAGIDPFTPESVVLAQALRGEPARSLEQRLAELDDLHRRGVITGEEHAAARRAALQG